MAEYLGKTTHSKSGVLQHEPFNTSESSDFRLQKPCNITFLSLSLSLEMVVIFINYQPKQTSL